MKSVSLVLSVVALATTSCPASSKKSGASAPQVSLILSAYGDASYGETQPFLKALEGQVDRTSDAAFCSGIFEGTLSGQPVVVATTGDGSDNSGPCMLELLYLYGPRVKEVIWSGVAGVTPAVGGLVDSATGALKTAPSPVMIGDVCISALAWNYDLHFSSVNDWRRAAEAAGNLNSPSGGWWGMKGTPGQTTFGGFADVQEYTIADKALADELVNASQGVQWPAAPAAVVSSDEVFFTGGQLRGVRAFDYTQCGEVSSNSFWYGAVEDGLARQYLASLITASQEAGPAVTANDVVVFSAMESAAWMSVLTRWMARQKTTIPMAVVRGASDYDHQPLNADGSPKMNSDGTIPSAMADISAGLQFTQSQFAAATAAAAVLKMFELR